MRFRAGVLAMAVAVTGTLVTAAPPAANAAPAAPTAAAQAGGTALDQALEQARQTGQPVQVPSATTDSATLAANPDGTLTATEADMPVRALSNGSWVPLDATLQRNTNGTVSPAVTTNRLQLSGGGTGPLAVTTTLGHTLTLSFPGLLPAPVLSGATATYAGVLPGVDLVMTADKQGGFDDILVVRNATAARNPALRTIAFRMSMSDGLTVHTDANGILSAATRGGHVIFQEPAPTMWDSRPAPGAVRSRIQPDTRQRVDLRSGLPVASGAGGAGEAARTARVGLRYSDGALTFTPDMALLAGKATTYPVYIDPVTDGAPLSYWAEVNSIPATDIKPSEMQAGDNGWQSPFFVARSFVTMAVPSQVFGSDTKVSSATLFLTETDGPTCDASAGDTGLQVWRTGNVSSSSVPSWSSQPSWIAEEDVKSFVHGWDSSCPAASEGFNVAEAAKWAASGSQRTITFGLKGDNESDRFTWKEFSSTVTMSITFDKTPTVGPLSTSPATACTGGDTVGKGDMTLFARIGSPLGSKAGSLSATFTATDTTTGHAVPGLGKQTGFSNGDTAPARITETTLNSLAAGKVNAFSWSVTVSDGTLSATSKTCTFMYDPTTPGVPTVTQGSNGWTTTSSGEVVGTIGTRADFAVTPPDGSTISGYDYQLNGASATFVAGTGSVTLHLAPFAKTNVLAVTAISTGGNVGFQTAEFIFNAVAPANRADGDLTGGGAPDLITPGGGTTGLASGLWVGTQQQAPGQSNGSGILNKSMTDIGQFGNGFTGDQSPADFTGAQAITGLFSGDGLQDTLVYYPSTGQGAILDSNGDGTPIQDKDGYLPNPDNPMDSALTTAVSKDCFTNADPNGDFPIQVANGYAADPMNTSGLPDLITINGDPKKADGTGNGYYLEYYRNGSSPGVYGLGLKMQDASPDNTDWSLWKITTMAEPNGTVDMFLYKPSSGLLYLWQNYKVTSDTSSNPADTYTPYVLSANWQPVGAGNTVSELRAADITGAGPALWAVSTTGTVTPWFVSNLSSGTGPIGTGSITAGAPDSLLSPTHAWRLGDGSSGAIGANAGADTGAAATPWPMSGTGAVTWNDQNDLFKPSPSLVGTTGYLSESTAGFNDDQDYTVSAWVKPNILGGVVLSQDGANTACMVANIDGTTVNGVTYGRWNFGMSSANSPGRTWTIATSGDTHYVKLGAWTHITMTYSSAHKFMRLYVNGTPAATATPAATWASGCNTFTIGRYIDAGQQHGYFNGKIADVQLWAGTALTPTEVADISGTPGYILFPTNTSYTSAASPTTWQWTTPCGEANFYQGKITIKQTCTGTSTFTFGPGNSPGAKLDFQGDGNLVIYNSSGTAIWDSGTQNEQANVLFFQTDGNLVIYDTTGATLWTANSQNAPIDM
jgi:hypothetical protein